VVGPADVPKTDPVFSAGAGFAARPGDSAESKPDGVLTWSELADACWLSVVTRDYLPAPEPEVSLTIPQSGTESIQDSVKPEPPREDPDREIPEPEFVLPEPVPPRDLRSDVVLTDGVEDSDDSITLARGEPVSAQRAPQWLLTGARDVVRAMRPFKRNVPDRRHERAVLDEIATAERAAEDGLWIPVTKPTASRWLDLMVVVDTGPSMALWRPTVKSFLSVLHQLGAFRSIGVRLLGTEGPDEAVLRGGTPDAPPRGAGELVDPSGRRLVLVLTDGVSGAWRRGSIAPLLARWASAQPVAILNLLPQRLWNGFLPSLRRARLSAPSPMRPNRRYGLELPDSWLEEEPDVPAGTVPIPLLELDPRWLGWWARLVTGGHRGPVPASVLLAHADDVEQVPEPTEPVDQRKVPAGEQVRKFFGAASPTASKLATVLAAVPVTLPIARLLQAEFVPEAAPSDLAELFAGGLLEKREIDSGVSWDEATFDFPDDVRAVLLGDARRSDTARAIRVATTRFGEGNAALTRLRDALEEPDSTPDPTPRPGTASEVKLERAVMRALSGPYRSRADRLNTIVREMADSGLASAENATTEINNEPVSETMPKAPDRVESPREPASTLPGAVEASQSQFPQHVSLPSLGEEFAALANTARHERQAADEAPPVWGAVPPRNPNFTGRSALLDQLTQRLTAGTTAVLPAALHGMGGIGKTQMAVEYIYRHLADYDLVWWIQATEPTQIRTAFTELAQHLRLPGREEAITAVPAVREALRLGRPYRRWLLVFDSAESPEAVRPFFPVDGPGDILITSRNPEWGAIARPLEVAVFDREESKELLRRRGPEIEDAEADQLAERLGDLPLAIEQAAAWRAETGMPVQEYLRLFDEKVTEILDTSAPTDYEVSVAAAWNVSFDELGKRSVAAHQLLQVCAFFSADPIARSLFTGVRGVSISPELDSALRDPMRLSRAIRDINRYGLAKIDHRNDTIQLHRLVQLVLRNRMNAQTLADMRHGAHMLLANLDPNDPTSTKQWPRYIEVLPHVYASELIDCDDRWVRQLVVNLINFLYHWGDHQGALTLAERAVTAWSQRLGEADPQTLQASERYGFYLWALGRFTESREINARTLRLYRETVGDDSEETLNAQRTVAADLKGSGDFLAALELNEQTYLKAKALFGDDDPATLRSAHDYIVSLYLVGDYRKGHDLAEAIYGKRVQVLGYDNASTINTLTLLIILRRELGDYVWARGEQEKITERVRELFGEDSAMTLRCFFNLAVARRKDGEHTSATELSRMALERYRLRYGERHPGTMAATLAYSIDIRHTGNLAEAKRVGEQAFNLYRDTFGENHVHTLSAALDLGVTLRLMGEPAAARQTDEKSLEKMREQFGPDYPLAIVCAIGLASDMFALSEVEAALELDLETAERASRVLGENHPTTLGVQANVAVDLRELGRTQESETRHADVVTRYRAVLGDTHAGTIAAARGARAECDIDPMPL
jgi:tetratricopeptide (TPR) repeat protein